MSSEFLDPERVSAYERFEYDFRPETLAGKVILAPGGTGGLGAATASLLIQEGVHVVAGYHQDSERAGRLSAALNKKGPGSLRCVQGDLRQPGGRAQLIEAAKARGELYGLVNFLGDPARVDFAELDEARIQGSMSVNYAVPVLLARDVAQVMQEAQTAGSIVFLSTMQAVGLFEGSVNYAAPKAALVHTARILARQWTSLRVNVVAPGVMQTGMALKSIQQGKYDHFVRDGIVPRFGRAEDVARVIRLLLEPDSYLTGQVITVDGGLTLRR